MIITAIKSFTGNPHDSKTIEPLLDQMQSKINYLPKEVMYDRGEKEQKQIGQTKISTPDHRPLKRDTEYQKRTKRKKFRRRAAIEPVIGHLKTDFEWYRTICIGLLPHKSMLFLQKNLNTNIKLIRRD